MKIQHLVTVISIFCDEAGICVLQSHIPRALEASWPWPWPRESSFEACNHSKATRYAA
jgi:hypothetical protein